MSSDPSYDDVFRNQAIQEASNLLNYLSFFIDKTLEETKINDTFTESFENYIAEADEITERLNKLISLLKSHKFTKTYVLNEIGISETAIDNIVPNLRRIAIEGKGIKRIRRRKRKRTIKRKRKQRRKN